eukprot:6156213-Alexandrium_andersonii.AAC.1
MSTWQSSHRASGLRPGWARAGRPFWTVGPVDQFQPKGTCLDYAWIDTTLTWIDDWAKLEKGNRWRSKWWSKGEGVGVSNELDEHGHSKLVGVLARA